MPFANINDIQIYYEMSCPENANAPKLLYIGGTGGDLRVQPNIMSSSLAKNFNLLAYDQRGLGQTKSPNGPYTMTQYGDDAAAIMRHVGWDNASVYGVSFGGMVAQHLTIDHPQCVDKLVLACTSSGGLGNASFPLHDIHHLEGRERFTFMLGISDTRNSENWQNSHPDQVEKMWQFSLKQRGNIFETDISKQGAFLQIEARKNHDTRKKLRKINAETLICGGEFDGLAPPSNLESLHSKIPASQLKFYRGGHLFMLQDPQAVLDIEAFLLTASL